MSSRSKKKSNFQKKRVSGYIKNFKTSKKKKEFHLQKEACAIYIQQPPLYKKKKYLQHATPVLNKIQCSLLIGKMAFWCLVTSKPSLDNTWALKKIQNIYMNLEHQMEIKKEHRVIITYIPLHTSPENKHAAKKPKVFQITIKYVSFDELSVM